MSSSGICMSEKIYLEVKDKSKYNIIDVGPQKLKNIDTHTILCAKFTWDH